MRLTSRLLAGTAIAITSALPIALVGQEIVPAHLTAAVNSVARPNVERSRDVERKPADVLTFAEVKSGAVVAEIVTSDVYWTRLFSKAVGPRGNVYAVSVARGARTYGAMRTAMEKAAADAGKPKPFDPHAAALAVQFETDFKNVKALAQLIESWDGNFALPAQADVVFVRDVYHDFHNSMPAWSDRLYSKPYNMAQINRAIYRAMNPGAVLVIADYAAAPGAGFNATESLKRSDPEAVKAEVTAVGFEFVGSSDAWANPADDRSKPADAAARPDRFLLKFRKPRTAPAFDRRPKGEVLAAWGRGVWENTESAWHHDKVYGWMWYHADGTLQERCCPPNGGNPNGALILSTYFWDAAGHNCQYHEAMQGLTVCHALETPEALNSEPGGYAYASLNGFPDNRAGLKVVQKGIVLPDPPPADLAAWRAATPKNTTIPLHLKPTTARKAIPKLPGLTDSDYLYCRIADTANSTVYFSNVILGDFSQSARFAAAFTDYVHGKYPGSTGNATCASTKDFWQTRAKEDAERAADDKSFKVREDTGWHYMLDGPYGFR